MMEPATTTDPRPRRRVANYSVFRVTVVQFAAERDGTWFSTRDVLQVLVSAGRTCNAQRAAQALRWLARDGTLEVRHAASGKRPRYRLPGRGDDW